MKLPSHKSNKKTDKFDRCNGWFVLLFIYILREEEYKFESTFAKLMYLFIYILAGTIMYI